MRTVHMGQSVEGPLRNWKAADWKRATKWMTGPNGRRYTAEQLKDEFFEMHAKGWKLIPFGIPCEGWSYQTGCPGHPIPDAVADGDSAELEEGE